LIQTIGRAARNLNGFVVMYGDKITPAMESSINETKRRREIQEAHNKKHGITPQSIKKAIKDISQTSKKGERDSDEVHKYDNKNVREKDQKRLVMELEAQMDFASQNLQFEKAAELRDEIDFLKQKFNLK